MPLGIKDLPKERRVLRNLELEYSVEGGAYIETHTYSDGTSIERIVDPLNRDEVDLIRKRIDYLQGHSQLANISPRQELIMEIENYPTDSMEEQDFLDSIVFNLRSGG